MITRYPAGSPQLSTYDPLALTEQVRILSKERLKGAPIAKVDPSVMASVELGISYCLGLPD